MRAFDVFKLVLLINLFFLEFELYSTNSLDLNRSSNSCKLSGKPFVRINNSTWRLMEEDEENVRRKVLRIFLNDQNQPIHMPWDSVRQCLVGRSITFVGDSLARYQYLNLVHFITLGKWYSLSPPFEYEPSWSSWQDFYQGTTARLTAKNGQTREKCDCYRNHEDTLSRENRYYENLELNLSISYIQYSWGISKRGMDINTLTLTNCQEGIGCIQASCPPGDCSETHWTAHDHMDLLQHVASTLHPDTLIFNSGIWHRRNNPFDEAFTSVDRINDLLELSRTLPRLGIRNLIWKTTTATNEGGFQLGSREIESIIPALERDDSLHRWRIFDAFSLTSSVAEEGRSLRIPVYYDAYHFCPDIYRGLNEVLLHMILSE